MDLILRKLNEAGVRYLLVGGQAVRLIGLPRFSMDWDLWLPSGDSENLARLNAALADVLDLEVADLGPRGENFVQTYQTPEGILQFHLKLPGLADYDEAERHAVTLRTEGGESVRVLAPAELLRAKVAVGRPQDLEDAAFLRLKLGKS